MVASYPAGFGGIVAQPSVHRHRKEIRLIRRWAAKKQKNIVIFGLTPTGEPTIVRLQQHP